MFSKKDLNFAEVDTLAKSCCLVKIFRGIIARRHQTDRKHMGLPKEQCAE